MMRPVGQPLFHAQEIQNLVPAIEDVQHVDVIFGQTAHGRHHREHHTHEFSGQIAEGIDDPIDVLLFEAPRPHIDEAVFEAVFLGVGVKVDGRDGQSQVLHALRMECRVAECECATFANAQEIDGIDIALLAHELDAVVEISFDVVVKR